MFSGEMGWPDMAMTSFGFRYQDTLPLETRTIKWGNSAILEAININCPLGKCLIMALHSMWNGNQRV